MRTFSDPQKLRTLDCIRQRSANLGYFRQDTDRVFGIDLAPGVAWLVIVAVQAGEEKQRRHLPGGKRGLIAGPISANLRLIGLKSGVLGCMLHQSFECRSSGDSATYSLLLRRRPIMSILIIATAFERGFKGWAA